MKKIITLVIAVVSVFCMAFTAMAASGVSSDEQALLDKFSAFITSWSAAHPGDEDAANQYIAEATNALIQVDLDAAACADLAAAIDKVEALSKSKGWASNADAWADREAVLQIVNPTANKYNMNVTLDSATHYATVTITTPAGPTPGGSTRPAVNQTGVDMTATIVVIVALLAVFGTAVVISRRKFASR